MSGPDNTPHLDHRQVERAERRKARKLKAAALESPILERLRAIGYELATIQDAPAKYAPLPDDFTSVILDSIMQYSNSDEYTSSNVLEMLIRTLSVATHPFDGRALAECYSNNNNPVIRWLIISIVSTTRPHSINEWISEFPEDSYFIKTFNELSPRKHRPPPGAAGSY